MKAADIFDVVLERVRECQALEARIGAIRADACAKNGPPRVGNVGAEYVADFYRCGERILAARWPRHWEVFLLYFADGGNSADVMEALGVRERTFWRWCEAIKRTVGPELARCGLFPPRKYRERLSGGALRRGAPAGASAGAGIVDQAAAKAGGGWN